MVDSLGGARQVPVLPEELIARFISAVVGEGLRVSNGAQYDVDLVTIRSLLATSVSVRHETLRQVFRRPLRFRLSGENSCDCPPQLESIGHKECRCTLLLQKIVRLPLARWTRVVVHFVPFPAQGDDGDHQAEQTRRAEDEADGTGTTAAGGEIGRGVAVRSEFRAAVQRVTHYSRSLATTLYFLLKQRANLSCEAACCGVIEMSRRRHYGPVYCSYDPKFPALPYDVDFVFETPGPSAGEDGRALDSTAGSTTTDGGGEEEDQTPMMPLWTMNMVDVLLMPWWRFVSKRCATTKTPQITLPGTIAAAFTMGRDRIAAEFPHRPADVAERLQRDFGAFWAVRPGSMPSSDATASLWPCVVKFDGSLEWYLSPAPLKRKKTRASQTTTTKWTIRGVPVLRIVVPERDSDDGSEGRWKGEFLASDG